MILSMKMTNLYFITDFATHMLTHKNHNLKAMKTEFCPEHFSLNIGLFYHLKRLHTFVR